MAGRPQRTLKLLGELEIRAFELARDMARLMPERYRNQENNGDPVADGWRNGFAATRKAWWALCDIGFHIRLRAGIDEKGATAGRSLAGIPAPEEEPVGLSEE